MAETKQTPIDRLIEAINGWIEGDEKNTNPKARGILADLRAGLSESTEYRAWPHILGINAYAFDKSDRKAVWLTIAGGMALLLNKKDESLGNMGATLKTIAKGQGEEGLNSFASRFRRLLSCRRQEEICPQLIAVFRAAKQKEVPIDFKKLYWDLIQWNNPERKVKIEWAKAYWGSDSDREKGAAS